ncbi:LssY C-terminal domain-containing protein [Bosea sp. 2KB_26]|uniref:LssY C-terminal domain-containing protein n=1 Tax=Bosea sp. 2KB_26 TaxID=3237475 RepID=UPI003F936DBF
MSEPTSTGEVRRKRRAAKLLAATLILYLGISYLILPAVWTRIEHEPELSTRTMLTANAQGIPGDPINVGLIGTRDDVVRAFHAAGWYPADPVTLRTSLEIIGSVLLDRPYKTAPVSPLYFEGRREDLAFERPAGTSADRREHVRLWQALANGTDARPVWLGSATFDSGVTLSRDTGQVTHRIAPNIDEERNRLIDGLNSARMVVGIDQMKGIGPMLTGRNAEGDPYYSDGEIWIARLVIAGGEAAKPAETTAPPPLIQLKDAAFSLGARLFAD